MLFCNARIFTPAGWLSGGFRVENGRFSEFIPGLSSGGSDLHHSDVLPGLVDIHVQCEGLDSSNVDCMLDSVFVDEAALKGYTVHPAHVEVATTKVRPNVKQRLVMDYEA